MALGSQPAANSVAGMGVDVHPKVNGNKPVNGAHPSSAVVVNAQAARPERKAGGSVRLAQTEADIAAMIALGRLLHAESRFRDLPLDDARMQEIGRRGLASCEVSGGCPFGPP